MTPGLDPDDGGDDDDLEEGHEADSATSLDLLDDLQARFEAEKEALMRQIRGLDARHLTEHARQAELLRLKMAARQARREENFNNAARLIGLAERQEGELSEKYAHSFLGDV